MYPTPFRVFLSSSSKEIKNSTAFFSPNCSPVINNKEWSPSTDKRHRWLRSVDLSTTKVMKHVKHRVTRIKTLLFIGSVCLNLYAFRFKTELYSVLGSLHGVALFVLQIKHTINYSKFFINELMN